MQISIDPTVDYAFKKLLGTESNKHLLLSFINSILSGHKQGKIVEITLLNPFNDKDYEKDKLSILDIKAKNECEEYFLIEMQVIMNVFYTKRLLYYWSRIYQSQLKSNEDYELLNKTTLISISKESLPVIINNEDEDKDYVNQYKLINTSKSNIVFCDDIEIYTIELNKFQKESSEVRKSLDKWLFLFKNAETMDDESLPHCIKDDKNMVSALKELKKISMDDIQREAYESRRMAIMDEKARTKGAHQKGRQEGLQEGLQKGHQKGREEGIVIGKIETILEMKFNDLSLMEEIQKISELNKLEKIMSALKEMKTLDEFKAFINSTQL